MNHGKTLQAVFCNTFFHAIHVLCCIQQMNAKRKIWRPSSKQTYKRTAHERTQLHIHFTKELTTVDRTPDIRYAHNYTHKHIMAQIHLQTLLQAIQ